jgi:hypothetical protein
MVVSHGSIARTAAFALAAACAVHAQPSAAAEPPVSEHVSLIYQGNPDTVCPFDATKGINARSFFRIWPSGARAQRPFIVPPGRDLVVTDVSWAAPYFLSSTAPVVGASAMLKLAVHRPNGQHQIVVFESQPMAITPENASAQLGTTEYMTTGIRVGPWRVLCAAVDDQGAGFDAGTLDPAAVYLHGRLVSR